MNSLPAPIRKRPLALLWTVVVACWSFLIWPASPHATTIDELSQQNAVRIANAEPWTYSADKTASFRDSLRHPLGIQTISVERVVSKNTPDTNQVRIYQFNYQLISSRVVVVSLKDNRVLSQAPINSVHLPLNQAERHYVSSLLAEDTTVTETLQRDQVRRGQPVFENVEDLSAKASIFVPMDAAHPCAQSRCALVSFIDSKNVVFSDEPVVNLQTGSIGWITQ